MLPAGDTEEEEAKGQFIGYEDQEEREGNVTYSFN